LKEDGSVSNRPRSWRVVVFSATRRSGNWWRLTSCRRCGAMRSQRCCPPSLD